MARYFCNKCRGRHRCTCASSAQSAFATETVNKVVTIPVEGQPGAQGNETVFLYTKTLKDAPAPTINQVPNPSGWSRQIPTLAEDEQLWEVNGVLNADGTVLVKNWTTPVSNISGVEAYAPETDEDIFDI